MLALASASASAQPQPQPQPQPHVCACVCLSLSIRSVHSNVRLRVYRSLSCSFVRWSVRLSAVCLSVYSFARAPRPSSVHSSACLSVPSVRPKKKDVQIILRSMCVVKRALLYSPPAETRLTVYRRLDILVFFTQKFIKSEIQFTTGGKPSTWFPPEGLVEQKLKNGVRT